MLYLEGEPRFEYKFLRRAVEDDPQLLFGSILDFSGRLTHADQQVISDSDLSAAALHALDVVVLGSLGRSAFTDAQLAALAEWVEAGGSLLLLGGRHALAHGDWAGSALDPLFPVDPTPPPEVVLERRLATRSNADLYAAEEAWLEERRVEDELLLDRQKTLQAKMENLRNPGLAQRRADERRINAEIAALRREQERLKAEMEARRATDPLERGGGTFRTVSQNTFHEVHVEPEPAAFDHPALAFEEGAGAFFEELPALGAFQIDASPRAEAVVLLRAREDPSFAVLSYSEHGKGICAVLAATNTYAWQMRQGIDPSDTRHERFWTSLLRWLGK